MLSCEHFDVLLAVKLLRAGGGGGGRGLFVEGGEGRGKEGRGGEGGCCRGRGGAGREDLALLAVMLHILHKHDKGEKYARAPT